jgi:PTH1 family peptidyl-tRNA hydrolase
MVYKEAKILYIIVGLGNPGDKYEKTRHNVGFNVIDLLAKEYSIDVSKLKHKALIGEGRVGTEKVILVKPMTYMNLSGESVVDICNYYNVDLENVIVIYDDIDLDVGKIRIRKKGSGGTHNGMRSIIKCLGSNEFPRVRVGISKPKNGQDLADFVLSRFAKEDEKSLNESFENAVAAIDCAIRQDLDLAMNRYNVK